MKQHRNLVKYFSEFRHEAYELGSLLFTVPYHHITFGLEERVQSKFRIGPSTWQRTRTAQIQEILHCWEQREATASERAQGHRKDKPILEPEAPGRGSSPSCPVLPLLPIPLCWKSWFSSSGQGFHTSVALCVSWARAETSWSSGISAWNLKPMLMRL